MKNVEHPAVGALKETQRKIYGGLISSSLMTFLETQKRLKTIMESNPFKEMRQFTDAAGMKKYSKTFYAIENINKQLNLPKNLGSALNYSYFSYDFLKFEEETPEEESREIETAIVKQTKSIKRIITDIYKDNTNLLRIGPRQFEEMTAELLFAKGFKVELTKQTKDNGYDIIALQILEKNFPLKFLVECKRYTKDKVGIDIIRSFKEVIQTEKANKGIIVTTSYFTKESVKKRLETPYLLDYKDKDDVLNWVSEYCNK